MRTRTPLIAVGLALVMVLAVANSASAATGKGAKTNQYFCNPTPFGVACFDLNYVVKETTTPSGTPCT